MTNHKLEGYVGDLMAPQSYGAVCACGWSSRYLDRSIADAFNRWSSHVYEMEVRDD